MSQKKNVSFFPNYIIIRRRMPRKMYIKIRKKCPISQCKKRRHKICRQSYTRGIMSRVPYNMAAQHLYEDPATKKKYYARLILLD